MYFCKTGCNIRFENFQNIPTAQLLIEQITRVNWCNGVITMSLITFPWSYLYLNIILWSSNSYILNCAYNKITMQEYHFNLGVPIICLSGRFLLNVMYVFHSVANDLWVTNRQWCFHRVYYTYGIHRRLGKYSQHYFENPCAYYVHSQAVR